MILGKRDFPAKKLAALLFATALSLPMFADDKGESEEKKVIEGHSFHGEAFNEGPRQSAYLMKGMGRVRFPVTTDSQEAQLFFTQGVAQLHGFWYFEAERSFRQAAMLDPDCAMAYWGMAVANRNNTERAKKFIEEAKKRRDKADKREKLWIDSEVNYWADTKKAEKDRRKKMVRDLETIIYDYPDDIEAKAFLAVWLWQSAYKGLSISSHMTVNLLIQDVLAASRCIRATTFASTFGITKNRNAPSPPPRAAASPHPASPTCGTCPATPIPSSSAIRTPPGSRKPAPGSTTPT